MEKSLADWSPQPSPAKADEVDRGPVHRRLAGRRGGGALVRALFLVPLGLGCGGPSEGIEPRDGGVDADVTMETPDASVPRPDAGPPPFFNYPIKLTASDGASNNWFGWSVAATEDVIVVGAPFYDEFDETGAIVEPSIGAAYVFERVNGNWVQTIRLITDDEETSSMFGWAVATNGDVIAVGAWNHDVGSQKGAVFVFERQGGTWVETTRIDPMTGDDQDRFGFSLSMEGNLLAVGAPLIDQLSDASTPAYVFERDTDGSWDGTRLVAGDGSRGGVFGHSIALSGNTVVVGAPHDSQVITTAGAAYVFEYDGSDWNQVTKLVDPSGQMSDYFGRAVAIQADTIAVGAEFGGELNTGSIHMFERQGGVWTGAGVLMASDRSVDDRLGGGGMVVQDGQLVVGAHNRDDMGAQSGAAYVFEKGASSWDEISKLIANDGEPGDNLGFSVAVAGSMVVVGSRYDDDDGMESGSAYVFERLPDM